MENQIKIIFMADTHLGFDFPIKPRIERRRRGDDFFNNFKRVLNYAKKQKADFVLHGGDFFFRAKVPSKIIDLAYSMLLDFAKENIPFILVPGNHERSKMPTSIFLNHPNLFIFNKPDKFSFDIKNVKISISGFPCERKNSAEKFEEIIKTILPSENDDIKLLLTHQTYQNSSVKNYTFKFGKDVIKLESIPKIFDAVLSGHIHRSQVIVKKFDDKRVPVIYPGSIERTSFQEMKEDKGFYEIIYTKRENGFWKMKELNFKALPARPMVNINLADSIQFDELENYLIKKISKLPEDSIIRLKLESEKFVSHLSADFLRNVFPYSMNYELSGIRKYNFVKK